MVLLNRKKRSSVHADYVMCTFARKILMAKKQTSGKTNDGPMKRLYLDFVCKHCVELKSSSNCKSSQSFL